jgi:hypothetical protein
METDLHILIGADPELFAKDGRTGKFLSVHDLLPGTKDEPFGVEKGAIQVDGLAAEFNITPAVSADQFVNHVHSVKHLLQKMLKEKNEYLTLEAVPTAHFDWPYLHTLPDSAKALGCTPDFNAYTGEENASPNPYVPYRTGSGHVHIGFTKVNDPFSREHFVQCCLMTQNLDAILVPMSRRWDSDTERQTLYGQPGAFRPKLYGVEYRVLSNAWLQDLKTARYVYEASKRIAELTLEGAVLRNKDMTITEALLLSNTHAIPVYA